MYVYIYICVCISKEERDSLQKCGEDSFLSTVREMIINSRTLHPFVPWLIAKIISGGCAFSISISISLSLCLDALVASCRTERRPLSHDRSTAESRFTVSLGTWFWEICSIGELDAFSHGVEGCCSARGCFQLKTKCVAAFRQPTTLALYGLYFSALSRCHAIPKYIRPNAPANDASFFFVLLVIASSLTRSTTIKGKSPRNCLPTEVWL